MVIDRRRFILMCATGVLSMGGMSSTFADDGGGDNGGSGGGSGSGSGSGGSGSGSGSSGSGSGGSGSGSGSGGDDDSDDNSQDSGGEEKSKDQDRVENAVSHGKAAPLIVLKDFLMKNHPGKILKIDLNTRLGGFVYKVRILQAGNRVKSLTLDARTLQTKLF